MSDFHQQVDRLEKEIGKISLNNTMLDSLLKTVVMPQLRSVGKADQQVIKKAVRDIIRVLQEIFEV